MEHTQGQIECRIHPNPDFGVTLHWVHDNGHTEIASVKAAAGQHNDRANGKRMEACWNALAGVDDPAAFVEKVREACEAHRAGFLADRLEEIAKMLPTQPPLPARD
jgi:hypothetical protein